jgi:hypothetical protein
MKKRTVVFLLRAATLAFLLALAAPSARAVDNGNSSGSVWGELLGYVSFNGAGATPGYGVTVTGTELTGYAWSELTGWISFNCSNSSSCGTVNYKVLNDGSGRLSGYAWSELAGWISFGDSSGSNNYQVTLGPTGAFSGYAWSEMFGWIGMDDAGPYYGASAAWIPSPSAPTGVAATDGTAPDKVAVTWTKSAGATGYRVYRDNVLVSGDLGDVAAYDDTGADAPTVTPGAAAATDGAANTVGLVLAGASADNGATHTYKVVAFNATGASGFSTTDTGYRAPGTLSYQWQRSAGDSDAAYSNIVGATSAAFTDTDAPADGSGRYYRCILNAAGAAQQVSSADRGFVGGQVKVRIQGTVRMQGGVKVP